MAADLPLVCSLTPEALAARRERLLVELVRRADHQEQTADGYRLGFRTIPGLLMTLARAIEAERECCRFLRFAITAEADGGPISLELSGPPGTSEFLDALITQ